ncbi:Phospholipid-binding protein [Enhygromyxa salina]|uniref:Phospholipid-binding protein n=1 Tax=Enhygromyxa salina TaxID=215803 RepID=A0A0C2CZJ2_9BACT|nr:YbhB/YbcL family Raf kinase inhibitor-like protein [Enhygromyxa salina]KIG16396.1 Phospholipid-binding protein [Enhygromyxa salina]
MDLRSESFESNGPIPGEFAFCVPAEQPADSPVSMAPNRNPQLAWSDAPEGTKSFAIICRDPDAPATAEDVNKEGKMVSFRVARVDFCHWVLIDIPATATQIPAGSHSDGVTAGGKPPGATPNGQGLQGVNDYTGWFANDENMKGEYAGYDGPCPPWNDERLHHYHFTIYALDVETLGLSGSFDGTAALEAMEGHVLDRADLVGTYTLNPKVSVALSS